MIELGDVIKMEIEVSGERYLLIAVPLGASKPPLQFDRPWKASFLQWLRKGRPVAQAAELAGVSRRHADRCRGSDKEFAAAWAAVDALRKVAGGAES